MNNDNDSGAPVRPNALGDALDARWITLGEIVGGLVRTTGTGAADVLRALRGDLALGELRPVRVSFDDDRPRSDRVRHAALVALLRGEHVAGDPIAEWLRRDAVDLFDDAALDTLVPPEWREATAVPTPTAEPAPALPVAAARVSRPDVAPWLGTAEVLALTGMKSATTLRKRWAAGEFPAPRRLYDAPNGALRWRGADVLDWMDARASAGPATP